MWRTLSKRCMPMQVISLFYMTIEAVATFASHSIYRPEPIFFLSITTSLGSWILVSTMPLGHDLTNPLIVRFQEFEHFTASPFRAATYVQSNFISYKTSRLWRDVFEANRSNAIALPQGSAPLRIVTLLGAKRSAFRS